MQVCFGLITAVAVVGEGVRQKCSKEFLFYVRCTLIRYHERNYRSDPAAGLRREKTPNPDHNHGVKIAKASSVGGDIVFNINKHETYHDAIVYVTMNAKED